MITHERWKQIKEIFHYARDRTGAERSDYLDEVCKDDASLRDEVEALLTADADNDDFLSAPAYEFAAGMLASEETEFSVGQKVGRYEILCSLGAGGMGQIYLAHDAQLNRKIALKLISPGFATDPQRVRRFEQEARAASALNHPNVCVIHEIGITDNGRHFIAMEYIQGITLRDRLARGTLKPVEVLQVAVQVGAALASAHAVGIVHRDIKPENIMLRPDGYVKVVDFGLAKLTEVLTDRQHAVDEVRTESRAVMGTIKYMSPEQLREASVDEQTDIWSLGIVLYEMLTGSTPFEAPSRNESIALILSPQPPELAFPDEVPVQVREVVKKALEKNCDLRYKTVTKLTSDLSSLKRELEHNSDGYFTPDPGTQTFATRVQRSAIFRRFKSLTADSLFNEVEKTYKAAALFAGATGVLALLFFLPFAARWLNKVVNQRNAVQSAGVARDSKMNLLTNAGTSVSAAISPDGKWVAHAEEEKGKQLLKVTNAATFASSIAVAADDVKYLGVSFSPDSNYLYFTRREKDRDGILYRLAWPGNNPTMLNKHVDSPVSVSPRGDRMAFVRYYKTPEYALVLSDIHGTNEQVIATRQGDDTLSEFGLAWSPDGKMVVCPEGRWSDGFHTNLVGFDVETGHEQRIGQRSWFSIYGVAWQNDMTSLVISAREHATSPFHLWRIRLPDGTAQRLTFDTDEYRTVSLAAGKIVTIQKSLRWQIWVSSPGELQKMSVILPGAGLSYGLSWTRKGNILYSSMAPDGLNIFRVDPDGSNQVQLTANTADNYMPVASADGRFIVFTSNRNGPFNIWRMNAEDGSGPTQLTFSDANFYPSCSPDNQWVAYDNQLKRTMSNWKVPLEGGEPVMIGERYRMPVFSPDSKFIAARYDLDGGSTGVAILNAEGGRRLREFSVPMQDWQRVYWLSDHEFSYIKNVNGYSNIWSYDLRTGESKQLTDFNSDLIYAYAWSPDYKQLACQRGPMNNNVTIVSEE
ncbi:MAG TPA: protein kinase [Pyrinomonadaceae bacterium]|nr:protein kinase [Pyrinomonadaceae bacterium]